MDGKTIALCVWATAAVGTLIFSVGRYFWDKAESRAEERGRTSESVNDLKTTLGRIEGHLLSLETLSARTGGQTRAEKE